MNKMEYRVDAKIIQQLSLYFFMHGMTNFSLAFAIDDNKILFDVDVPFLKEDMLLEMEEKFRQSRAMEVEMYGWELMGDTDPDLVLDVLSAFIDSYKITKMETHYHIQFVRNKTYQA